MPKDREEYEGKEIVVETDDGEADLLIDGRRVEVSYHEEEDVYATEHFPYTNYESVMELARAVVNNWSRIEPGLSKAEEREDER
jgi:hypothetical protein